MDIENLVISISTAIILRHKGVIAPSCFSYYQTKDKYELLVSDPDNDTFVGFAYTMSELIAMLPGALTVDEHTYLSGSSGWYHPPADQQGRHAELKMVRIFGGTFIATYTHEQSNVAFSLKDGELPAYLVFLNDNPVEALAEMLLAWLEEKEAGRAVAMPWDDEI